MLAAPVRQADGGMSAAAETREAVVAALDIRVVSTMLEALRRLLPPTKLHVTDGTSPLGTLLASARPVLLLVDLNLIDYTVRELVGVARGLNQHARVVVIAGHGDDDRVLPALRDGAAGFLLKHEPLDEVTAQLRCHLAGVLPLTAALGRQLLRHLDRTGSVLRIASAEFELLRLIAAGDTPAEAAWRLKLQRDAVRGHVKHIFEVAALSATADV